MGKSKELAELGDVVTQSGGNVGIGTGSPTTKLDVNGSAYIRAGSILGLYNTDNTNQYQIYNGGSSGTNIGQLVFTQGGVAERMRIDASGRVTMPYQPAFRAYKNTDPGTNTTVGNMSWTGTEFNVGNCFANNRFTAPVAGTYLFGVNNNMGSGDSVSHWRIYKNGSQYHVLSYSDFTAGWKNSSGSTLMQLQANDYVEAWWRGDADYDINWCGFFGYLVG